MFLIGTQFRRHAAAAAAKAAKAPRKKKEKKVAEPKPAAAVDAEDVWNLAGTAKMLTLDRKVKKKPASEGEVEKKEKKEKKKKEGKELKPPAAKPAWTQHTGGKGGGGGQWTKAGAGAAGKVDTHPVTKQKITFAEKYHLYSVKGQRQKSVSSLLRAKLWDEEGQPREPVTYPFKKEEVLARLAERDGITPEDVQKEWDELIVFGTKFHSYVEEQLTGAAPEGKGKSWTATEREAPREQRYIAAWKDYNQLLTDTYKYELAPGGCEKIVFSPSRGVAGTLDCLMHCPSGNDIDADPHYLLLDWKTNGRPLRDQTPFVGEPQTLRWPFEDLPNVQQWSYVLQLNIYKHLLVSEGYVPANAKVRMAMVQFIMTPCGEVEVDGIEVEDLGLQRIARFIAASQDPAKKPQPGRNKLLFS